MEKAKEHLFVRHDPLQDIASRLGYQTYGSFHKTFKKHTGVSPSEYRRRTGSVV